MKDNTNFRSFCPVMCSTNPPLPKLHCRWMYISSLLVSGKMVDVHGTEYNFLTLGLAPSFSLLCTYRIAWAEYHTICEELLFWSIVLSLGWRKSSEEIRFQVNSSGCFDLSKSFGCHIKMLEIPSHLITFWIQSWVALWCLHFWFMVGALTHNYCWSQ